MCVCVCVCVCVYVCMYGYLCGLGFRFRVEVLDEYLCFRSDQL